MMNVFVQEEEGSRNPFSNLGRLSSKFKNSFCVRRNLGDSLGKGEKDDPLDLRIKVESTQIE